MKNNILTKDEQKAEFLLAATLVIIGIGTRLLFKAIDIPNFNAVTGTVIFAGAYLSRSKYGILVPFITMFITDAIIGFYDLPYMMVVYGSFGLMFFIARYYSGKPSLLRYILVTLGGSLTFFLVTNFAWWPFYTTLYPHTIGGLIQSYTMALPFYRNSLLSDVLFSAVLFGGFEMAKVFLPTAKKKLAIQ